MDTNAAIRVLLDGKIQLPDEEWHALLQKVQAPFLPGSYCCVLVDSGFKASSHGSLLMLLTDLPTACEAFFSNKHLLAWAMPDEIGRCVLILHAIPAGEELAHHLNALSRYLHRCGLWKNGSIIVGHSVKNLTDLHLSMDSAQNALQFRANFPASDIIYHDDVVKLFSGSSFISEAEYTDVLLAFRQGDIDTVRKLVSEYSEIIRSHDRKHLNGPSPSGIRRMFIELTVKVLHIGSDMGLRVDELLGGVDPYTHLMQLKGTPAIIDWFIGLCTAMYAEMKREAANCKNMIVNEAIKYIHHHLQECDLSLNEISASVGITANYLSALFSRLMKKPIIRYINELRVQESEDQLLNTKRTIQEIATRCGFSSAEYFHGVFKKQTGLTPGQFRKKNTGQS